MTLSIEGMHCQACVRRVQKALEGVPDVKIDRVEVGSAEVEAPAERQGAILAAVEAAGFTAQVAAGS